MEALKEMVQNMTPGHQNTPPAAEPSEDQLKALREKYEKASQDHVFMFYDSLNAAEKASLFKQLSGIDPDRINELAIKVLNPPKADTAAIEPLPPALTSSVVDSSDEDLKKWYEAGLDLVSGNKVAVVLMAGGQGTRLGSAAPKGCFDIGLPSKKSLFQIQAERIWKLQQLAKKKHGKDCVVPWYIMTSAPTRERTEIFFAENNYFGLEKKDILIFDQGVLPCISNEGKMILESKSKVAVAPDGNGGIYTALISSGTVADMEKRGVEHIHTYCVDNCLVKVADPTFIGFAASKDVDIAIKVVRKRNAKEPVGIIVQKNGRPDVVEYSEIDDATAEARDPQHPELLKFRNANIVNHYNSRRFFETIPGWAHTLPHHVAKKKIPCVDTETGATIKPEKPNGIKMEQFVFDCFNLVTLDKFACMEVRRIDDFSPLKNARGAGEDDPDTSRKSVLNQGRRWVEAAGGIVEDEGDDSGVEVSPKISYGGEGLEFLKGKTFKAPAVIEKE